MAKKSKPKKRGPARTTGRPGALAGRRYHEPFLQAVDGWRERQDDEPSRPVAIVRLAQLGLAMSETRGRPTSPKGASRAAEMAGQEIDRLGDHSATVEERAKRKRRLLKGPREFRDMRR